MEKISTAEDIWDEVVDMFDGDGVEEEADEVVDQVLDELGLEVATKLDSISSIPTSNDLRYDEVGYYYLYVTNY